MKQVTLQDFVPSTYNYAEMFEAQKAYLRAGDRTARDKKKTEKIIKAAEQAEQKVDRHE